MHKLTRIAVLFFASAPVLFVCWLVFVGNFGLYEMCIGMGVAIVGSVAITIVQLAEDAHFRPRLRDALQIVWVPWLFIEGTAEILFVAFRDLLGGKKAVSSFRLLTFNAGEECDPHDTARRVLAIVYTTAAPNFVILGTNVRDRYMLFHQIQKSTIPKPTKDLGAVT